MRLIYYTYSSAATLIAGSIALTDDVILTLHLIKTLWRSK
nr:MAG TPA: hypothetical protein [Caudoviricetes sp.]